MRKSFREIGKDADKVHTHGYDTIYPTFLEKLRDEEFNMLEIGVNEGDSMNLWAEYFPSAAIYGIDIDSAWSSDRCTTYKFDQSNPSDLKKIVEIIPKCKFIIDDGSHVPYHQLITFNELFNNLLEDGGTYIIEDIECNYWRSTETIYGYEVGYYNIVDYFRKLVDKINSKFSLTKNEMNISTITFGYNCIIITKKTNEQLLLDKTPYLHLHRLDKNI